MKFYPNLRTIYSGFTKLAQSKYTFDFGWWGISTGQLRLWNMIREDKAIPISDLLGRTQQLHHIKRHAWNCSTLISNSNHSCHLLKQFIYFLNSNPIKAQGPCWWITRAHSFFVIMFFVTIMLQDKLILDLLENILSLVLQVKLETETHLDSHWALVSKEFQLFKMLRIQSEIEMKRLTVEIAWNQS